MMATVNRIFGEGFRVFFLSAGIYGLFTGLVWTLWLGDLGAAPGAGVAPQMWHAHEMIFGYATAAIGGFFLTAVPNWTSAPGARQGFIATVAGLWIAGRLAVWYSAALPPVWVAVLDLAFVPVLAAKILAQLLKRPKPQNMMFLIFLTLLWVSNLMVHLEWTGVTGDSAETGLRGGLMTLCALISVLGGRVTPAFTRNAMKRAGEPEESWPQSCPKAERASLILALALPVLVLSGVSDGLTAIASILFGMVQIARLARWRWTWCLNQPILLVLHLSLGFLAVGQILWGAALFGLGSELGALHILGIGCVGGMTLGVMSRAALGHSGRDLIAPGPMALGYLAMAAAAILRWIGTGLDGLYLPSILATGSLWVAAFALFLVSMWPALTLPRQS